MALSSASMAAISDAERLDHMAKRRTDEHLSYRFAFEGLEKTSAGYASSRLGINLPPQRAASSTLLKLPLRLGQFSRVPF
ncbi:MAG TPA: hypothetical protein DEH10_20930 [Pseudomonas sp.]|nr:hypothetical protein [Pseudomonas sp.]|tara:strand:- start:26431 stop:26670 length:240 start_codon:yes stop_codon:yes gene_type:complete